MNNTPGPSPQHTPASAPAPSPATVASRHAARSTAPKPGAEQRRARPRRAVRPSGEPDAAKPKPKPKPKPHPPARHERPATPEAANKKPQQPQQADSSTDAADYPYVALTLQTTGIHPSAGRIVTIDAVRKECPDSYIFLQQLLARGHARLLEYVVDMRLHGPQHQVQIARDVLIVLAVYERAVIEKLKGASLRCS